MFGHPEQPKGENVVLENETAEGECFFMEHFGHCRVDSIHTGPYGVQVMKWHVIGSSPLPEEKLAEASHNMSMAFAVLVEKGLVVFFPGNNCPVCGHDKLVLIEAMRKHYPQKR